MTKLTSEGCCPRGAGKSGVGMPGGSAWTENWLQFDNRWICVLCGFECVYARANMHCDGRSYFPCVCVFFFPLPQ